MIGDAFIKPAVPNRGPKSSNQSRRDLSSVSAESEKSTGSRSLFSPTSQTSSRTSEASNDGIQLPTAKTSPPGRSSAALRETIAKAKAERRKAIEAQGSRPAVSKADVDDVLIAPNNKGLLRRRIEMARTDGRLNIAAMGLSEFPREVLGMYDLDSLNASDGAWYESVDITRLIAADNELLRLDDELFPDRSAEELRNEDDEAKGTLFGGLETLDLHGNLLQNVPVGLRQLKHLTTLNLSRNRLTNASIEMISQIESLKELRIAENALKGTLPQALYLLKELEVLDLHGNSISEFPDSLQDFLNLRLLNVAGNQLHSLPLEWITSLPLTELNVGGNRIAGTLLPAGSKGLPLLKSLDVSGNALTSICDDGQISMPELQTFNVGENRLTTLPDLSGWTNLATLSANNNNISAIPEGMIMLTKLRNLDLTGNNLQKLDDHLGMMESLTSLTIANNPLRERRFLTMATDNIKRELRNRLLPAESEDTADDPHAAVDPISHENTSVPSTWPVKTGGILDRSSTALHTITPSDLEPLQCTPIRSLIAHHNHLPSIPDCISIVASALTTLDLSHNKLTGTSYLYEPLVLPTLRDLNLASNTLTSLTPLLTHLCAPQLQSLNVSYNRLTAMSALRTTYPTLATLLASDNSIAELPVDSVRGLQVCDVSRNDIAHLEPALGLLEGEGLRMIGVEGNRFRVPRRDVVERGSGAVLAWLRGRIPSE